MTALGWEETILRLLAASLCGALLGIEREVKHRPAGLRTFMLVSLGSAGYSLTLINILSLFQDSSSMSMDPLRIIEGIIGGIGFLGAGAIIQSQGHVKGVTTGASIWISGSIGLSCGFGFYLFAFMMTGITLVILVALKRLSDEIGSIGEPGD